jgi:hypothetical protein
MVSSTNDSGDSKPAARLDADPQEDNPGESDQLSSEARPNTAQHDDKSTPKQPTEALKVQWRSQLPSGEASHKVSEVVTANYDNNASAAGRTDYSSRSPPRNLLSNTPGSNTASTSAAASAPSPLRNSSLVVQERENFLLFIKILFKILAEAGDPGVRTRAQRTVLECQRRSRLGDPNFIPLVQATEQRLRVIVGEDKWRRAHLFLHHYNSTRSGCTTAAHSALTRVQPAGV